MLSLLLFAAAAVAPAKTPALDRMVVCLAYRDTWQWDERKAGRKVPRDSEWFVPFHQKMMALGEAAGLDDYALARRNNAMAKSMEAGLTPKQRADWQKCIRQFGWKPNADGATYDF